MTACAAQPGSGPCLVTHEYYPVELCRVMRVRFNEIDTVPRLAHAWGIEVSDFDLDSPYNKINLKIDFHETFESGCWALVPSLEVLQQIATKALVITHSGVPWPSYLEWFPNGGREFRFAHFRGAPKAFVQISRDPNSRASCIMYEPPFDTVPPISTMAHPYFAVCDVAQKAIRWREKDVIVRNLPATLQEAVDLCIVIYRHWISCVVPQPSQPRSPPLPPPVANGRTSPASMLATPASVREPGQPPKKNSRKRAHKTDDEDDTIEKFLRPLLRQPAGPAIIATHTLFGRGKISSRMKSARRAPAPPPLPQRSAGTPGSGE